MKVYLGTDHAGFAIKESVKEFLQKNGYETEDCGAFVYDKDDDYPDFISIVARKVANNADSKGIIFGTSGAGEAIVANKIKGIRAVVGWSKENVERSRTHNDANILSLGSAFVSADLVKKLVKIFLETSFSNQERHIRRIEKIYEIESN